jgi:hypothetical protein
MMNVRTFIIAILTFAAALGGYFYAELSDSKTANLVLAEEEEDFSEPVQSTQIQVVTTAELMKLLVDPEYELLKNAVETPPEKRKQWRELYIRAFNIAEMTNLNFSRHDEDYMKTDKWQEQCKIAQDLCIKFAESVRARSDFAIIKENYLAVQRNCNNCHNEFVPDDVDPIDPPVSWMTPEELQEGKKPALF